MRSAIACSAASSRRVWTRKPSRSRVVALRRAHPEGHDPDPAVRGRGRRLERVWPLVVLAVAEHDDERRGVAARGHGRRRRGGLRGAVAVVLGRRHGTRLVERVQRDEDPGTQRGATRRDHPLDRGQHGGLVARRLLDGEAGVAERDDPDHDALRAGVHDRPCRGLRRPPSGWARRRRPPCSPTRRTGASACPRGAAARRWPAAGRAPRTGRRTRRRRGPPGAGRGPIGAPRAGPRPPRRAGPARPDSSATRARRRAAIRPRDEQPHRDQQERQQEQRPDERHRAVAPPAALPFRGHPHDGPHEVVLGRQRRRLDARRTPGTGARPRPRAPPPPARTARGTSGRTCRSPAARPSPRRRRPRRRRRAGSARAGRSAGPPAARGAG